MVPIEGERSSMSHHYSGPDFGFPMRTAAWMLKSIHKTCNGELAGSAMVGPHVADTVETRVGRIEHSLFLR